MPNIEGDTNGLNIPITVSPNDLEEYLSQHTTPEDDVLYTLQRHTQLTTYHPRMVSGQVQGKFLELVSHMVNPMRILEIGTFTGYSAICLARGLAPLGHLHTIEINDEVVDTAREYINRAGLTNRITVHVGDALNVIPTLNEKFDLVLIDGDKRQYPQYLDCVMNCLNSQGVILADNVLWGGKVLDYKCKDPFTVALREFNSMVQRDPRLENVLVPLRDGLMMIRHL